MTRPAHIFATRADTGETFTVHHFAPDRFETDAGERVEAELVPEGVGHTSMVFWICRAQRIRTVMVDGSERKL